MLRGVYTSASGMMVQAERQNVISNNLANVDTKGFKKDQTVIQAFPEIEIHRKDDEKIIDPFENTSKLTKIGSLGTGAQLSDVYTEHTQGRLERTDNKLDFAISGEGYFAVQTANGVKLTRDGAFAISTDGFLITQNGDKVIGQRADGTFGAIKPKQGGQFQLGRNHVLQNADIDGNITIPGTTPVPRAENGFVLLNTAQKNGLVKEGKNYYNPSEAGNMTVQTASTIEQGYLEGSTVSAVKEMVEMIECSRAYETNQKVLTSQDEAVAKVISEVGKWG